MQKMYMSQLIQKSAQASKRMTLAPGSSRAINAFDRDASSRSIYGTGLSRSPSTQLTTRAETDPEKFSTYNNHEDSDLSNRDSSLSLDGSVKMVVQRREHVRPTPGNLMKSVRNSIRATSGPPARMESFDEDEFAEESSSACVDNGQNKAEPNHKTSAPRRSSFLRNGNAEKKVGFQQEELSEMLQELSDKFGHELSDSENESTSDHKELSPFRQDLSDKFGHELSDSDHSDHNHDKNNRPREQASSTMNMTSCSDDSDSESEPPPLKSIQSTTIDRTATETETSDMQSPDVENPAYEAKDGQEETPRCTQMVATADTDATDTEEMAGVENPASSEDEKPHRCTNISTTTADRNTADVEIENPAHNAEEGHHAQEEQPRRHCPTNPIMTANTTNAVKVAEMDLKADTAHSTIGDLPMEEQPHEQQPPSLDNSSAYGVVAETPGMKMVVAEREYSL